jgi:hypothetical protein
MEKDRFPSSYGRGDFQGSVIMVASVLPQVIRHGGILHYVLIAPDGKSQGI